MNLAVSEWHIFFGDEPGCKLPLLGALPSHQHCCLLAGIHYSTK